MSISKINKMCVAYEQTKEFVEVHIIESLRNDNNVFMKYFTYNLNRLYGIVEPEIKTRIVLQPKKFERVPYKHSQKMSFKHAETISDSIKDIYEVLPASYNPKSGEHKSRLNLAKFLSKKYAKNEYVYLEYFFNKLSQSASKFSSKKFRQSLVYTEFNLKTVDYPTAIILNSKVDEYNDLHKKMHNLRIKFEHKKHKLNMLKSVQQFKKFDSLVKEYEKGIVDVTFKINTYENVNILHNENLIEAYQLLLIDAKVNRDMANKAMLQDVKYLKQYDKVNTVKNAYKVALKKVVDYRKTFKEYFIFKKIAAYKYVDAHNVICINGIKWNLKTPSGKLNSKTSLSTLQKAYNKVTFDKKALKLTVNSGL